LNCGNAVISLWLGLQPPEKHRHSSIGMISPIDYELAHQAHPEAENPDPQAA
jgi:hypothetical protein